jgi:hypothetical protein
MNKILLASLAMATALAIVPSALATTIPAGPATYTLTGPVAGGTASGSLVSNGGVNPTFTASYTETVFTYNGAGDLAFEYAVTDENTDSISNLSTNYGGYTDNALSLDWVSGDAVTGTENQASGTINVTYAGDLNDGDSSTFILFTDATLFAGGPIGFRDTYGVESTALVPAPEPSNLLLLGTGLLGLAFVAFRKAKASGVVLSL